MTSAVLLRMLLGLDLCLMMADDSEHFEVARRGHQEAQRNHESPNNGESLTIPDIEQACCDTVQPDSRENNAHSFHGHQLLISEMDAKRDVQVQANGGHGEHGGENEQRGGKPVRYGSVTKHARRCADLGEGVDEC